MCSPHSSTSIRSTTHDLARRFAAGDPEVLDSIQQRYGPGMHAAARDRLGGDRVLAEEAVQVALLKAWRAAPRFDASRELGPWLYAITRRCAIDIRRHEFRHRTESIERISRLAGDGDPDGFETAWETNVVREAVAALPVGGAHRDAAHVLRRTDAPGDRGPPRDPDRHREVAYGARARPAARVRDAPRRRSRRKRGARSARGAVVAEGRVALLQRGR